MELGPYLERTTFPQAGTAAVCGLSGGQDSVALVALAKAAGLEVTAIHVDHGLREGSSKEVEVVEAMAQKLGVKFVTKTAEIKAGSDWEQRARIERHKLLGPDAMLGHTKDDQAETLLINLLRGAGVSGLAGIEPGHRHPILSLRRSETADICALAGIKHLIDESNLDPRFQRNRIRNEVLPLLSDVSKRDMVPLLAKTAFLARQTNDHLLQQATTVDPTDTRALQQLPRQTASVALREWLRDELGHPPSTAELDRTFDVVHHRVKATELSGKRRLARTDGVLRIEQN